MARSYTKSAAAFERAKKSIPGGVNSPVRAFRSVGGHPIFFERGEGAYVWDIDGNRYIDYVGSWGPLITGHAHPNVLAALADIMKKGTSFGAPTELESEMAELICAIVPSVEMVRMVNSGTEAVLSALRLARAFTKRDKIIKFEGCYHGHADSMLVHAGSGVATLGLPDSPGVSVTVAKDTITVPYNNVEAIKAAFDNYKNEIAAVIIEPVVGNMGCVIPQQDYLEGIRELCTANGTVLIFDEVMTGFRVALGGAQERFGIKPDLTTMGKVIGGGLPVGAYGGRADIMAMVAPSGPMYQAGTLSGNPLAMIGGYTTLKLLQEPGVYDKLEAFSKRLCDGIAANFEKLNVPATHNRVGAMFSTFFTATPVVDYDTAKTSDTALFKKYYWNLLNEGIYMAPSQFEAGFMSLAHTEADVDFTIAASYRALEKAIKS